MLQAWPTAKPRGSRTVTAQVSRACAAVERARVYYVKRAWCLQSAAAATCFARLVGARAELVIGVRHIPFYAHAWVEVDEHVVMNDRPELHTLYQVIARC